ncbi:hypothetical protein [Marinifilum fragile]|uniref:hypothetical protein n=1 Tax=Marinifilum fragile TaxID=570161 RepID=UPI002AA76224|nr:hypothetical protein [Marinifilum fragile]
MSEQISNIELRSEKVRNIIGQIPSRIVRIGISVIFLVVFSLLVGAYLFSFSRTIDLQAGLYPENNKIHYTIDVPKDKMKHVFGGQKITIHVHDQISFNTTVQKIGTTLHVNKHHAYYKVQGVINNTNQQVNELVQAKARIYTGKTNVVDFVLNR